MRRRMGRRGWGNKEVVLRRHLPVLAHAFRFYGAWVFGLCAVAAALGGVTLGLLEAWWLAATFFVPTVAFGAAMGGSFVAVGRGLDQRRPWARWAGLALSALVIGDLPVGMALGLLGFGVLADDEVAACFDDPVVPVSRRLGQG